MKRLLSILLLLFVSSTVMAGENSYLFFQTAMGANLVKNKDQSYTLTLKNPVPHVSYFTDRPVRKSGLIDLKQFISLWTNKKVKNNFTEVPPNAEVAMILNSGRHQHFAAVVSNPDYTNNTISYKLDMVNKHSIATGDLKAVNIFFDDIHWNPGGF